jgi:hypothetical protein
MLLDSAHTLFIDPRPNVNPHVPAGTTCIPLHPIALWPISTIPSLYVFPGELDLERLVEAVKDVSALWPVIAGRYVRKERPSDPNQSAFMVGDPSYELLGVLNAFRRLTLLAHQFPSRRLPLRPNERSRPSGSSNQLSSRT